MTEVGGRVRVTRTSTAGRVVSNGDENDGADKKVS